MYVSNLSLRDFRNYQRLDLQLPAGITLLYGPNAAGKTSVLDTRERKTPGPKSSFSWLLHRAGWAKPGSQLYKLDPKNANLCY